MKVRPEMFYSIEITESEQYLYINVMLPFIYKLLVCENLISKCHTLKPI